LTGDLLHLLLLHFLSPAFLQALRFLLTFVATERRFHVVLFLCLSRVRLRLDARGRLELDFGSG